MRPMRAALLLLAFAPAIAVAAPTKNVCVSDAIGVPTRPGPPVWATWAGVPGTPTTALDDPRWLGATQHGFTLGAAQAPVTFRALRSVVGEPALYLSFVMDLAGHSEEGAVQARDLFLGFRRRAPGGTGSEQAYLLQFHFAAGGAPGVTTPGLCQGSTVGCAGVDHWRAFVYTGDALACGGESQPAFLPKYGPGGPVGPTSSPAPWMVDKDAVRFHREGPSRWAVQLRIPVIETGALALGLERGARFWYEATAKLPAGPHVELGQWPRTLGRSICVDSTFDYVTHKKLDDGDSWSALTTYPPTPPAAGDAVACDTGLTLRPDLVGAIAPPAAGTDLATVSPTRSFRAGPNVVLAQPYNSSGAPITAPLRARFRIASWGSAPGTGDTGRWLDLPGAEGGVCAAPGCAPVTIAAGAKGVIKFDWNLGGGALGASELCKYELPLPGGAVCGNCTCTASDACDGPVGSAGTQAPGGKCVTKYYGRDQCMLVELSGAPEITIASTWHNMRFGAMSVFSREALIDARGLAAAAGQREHDIYLVVAPRNVTLAPGEQDGSALIRERAIVRAQELSAPYVRDAAQLSDAQLAEIAHRLGHDPRGGQTHVPRDERVRAMQRARWIMPHGHHETVTALLALASAKGTAAELTQQLVERAGPAEAARVVPTLEIYPFHRPVEGGPVYAPMTAFTVFLSHEGSLSEIRWLIDGATRVGENVYHLRIPLEHARLIQVRAQAVEASDPPIGPSDPKWPGGGGCCAGQRGLVAGVGGSMPGLLAGVFVTRRRRRRPVRVTTS